MPLLRSGIPTIDEESRFLDAFVSYVDKLQSGTRRSVSVPACEFHNLSSKRVNAEEQAFLRGEMQIPRTNTDIRNVSKTSSKHSKYLTGNELFDSIFLELSETESLSGLSLKNTSKQSNSSTRSWRSSSSFMGDMLPEKKTSKSRSGMRFRNLLLAGADRFRAHRNVHA